MKPLFASMLLAGMATLWLSAPAQARPGDPGVNARQHFQQQRIGQGVRSGEPTRAERADLYHDQNVASRHVYREMHDAERRC